MRRLVKNNIGSITVEITLIMPLLLLVTVLMIKLFLNTIVYTTELGDVYGRVYTCSDDNWTVISLEEFQDKLEAESRIRGDYEVFLNNHNGNTDISVITSHNGNWYENNEFHFNMEYGKCTDRLRRWQLYGDVICE